MSQAPLCHPPFPPLLGRPLMPQPHPQEALKLLEPPPHPPPHPPQHLSAAVTHPVQPLHQSSSSSNASNVSSMVVRKCKRNNRPQHKRRRQQQQHRTNSCQRPPQQPNSPTISCSLLQSRRSTRTMRNTRSSWPRSKWLHNSCSRPWRSGRCSSKATTTTSYSTNSS